VQVTGNVTVGAGKSLLVGLNSINNGTPPGNGGSPNTVCGSEQGRCVGM